MRSALVPVLLRGISLSSLFAKYGGGMDFTDLDITKTWGADAAKLLGKNATSNLEPITATTQGVAFIADKGRGLVTTGAELWTGGTASGTAGYATKSGTKWTVNRDASGTGVVVGPAVTAGKTYRIELDYFADGPGPAHYLYILPGMTSPPAITGPGHAVFCGVATATQNLFLSNAGPLNSWSFDNVSIKEILANSGYQTTSGSRPQWQTGNKLVFDGIDDYEATPLIPSTAMTLAVCAKPTSGANRFFMGARPASDNRCAILYDSSVGKFAGHWGSETNVTIFGGPDISGADFVGLMRANGSVVELWVNGTRVLQRAAAGGISTTIPLVLGAFNAAGTVSSFMAGTIYRALAIPAFVTDAEALFIQHVLGAGIVSF